MEHRKMKVFIVNTIVGFYALDEEGNIINVKNFKLNAEEVANNFLQIESGELPQELRELLSDYKKGELVVHSRNIENILTSNGFQILYESKNPIIDNFHREIISRAMNMGLFKNEENYLKFLYEVCLHLTRARVRKAVEKRDRLVVHAIETIDDLDKTINLFSSRLREFYGMHFPELIDAIENHYSFSLIVSKTGDKANITNKLLVDEIKLPAAKAEAILKIREKSMGSPLLSQDIQIIQEQAKIVVELFKRRQLLEQWMDQAMKAIAPNISGLVSSLLGARLIAIAGSLKELALCPSSKIQVLGAEKALYRTLKTGAPPPKHGIIYQDPRINQAKWWLRGKIARVISSRLSIAARMDFFESEDKSKELIKEVKEKLEEIQTKYPEPPKKSIKGKETSEPSPPTGKFEQKKFQKSGSQKSSSTKKSEKKSKE